MVALLAAVMAAGAIIIAVLGLLLVVVPLVVVAGGDLWGAAGAGPDGGHAFALHPGGADLGEVEGVVRYHAGGLHLVPLAERRYRRPLPQIGRAHV